MLNSLTASELGIDRNPRPIPHNLEIEQALLGALLVNNSTLERVSGIIQQGHFFDPLHADIFEAISEMVEANRSANPLTLKGRFEASADVGPLTAPQYLGSLAALATTANSIADYARAIVDLSTRRALILIGEDVINEAYDLSASVRPQVLIEDAERRLFEIVEKDRSARDEMMFSVASHAAVKAANDACMSGGRMRGLSTGIRDLDDKLGGLQKTDLIILAGRPSMGKTALAMNIAWHVARNGRVDENGEIVPCPVDFRSLEMSGEQLATRVLSMIAGVSSEKMRRGTATEAEMRRVIEAAREVDDTKMVIDESGSMPVGQLAARVRRTKRKHDTQLVVVDYLQLLHGSGKRRDGNRTQEVTEITVTLKALAKELQVPIIALSQLSRATEQREGKRPQLSDLRESGSIEQDADVVMFAFREEYYVERREPDAGNSAKHAEWQQEMQRCAGKAEVIIGKQRHGPTGVVPLAFNGELTRFSDLARGGGGHG